MRDSVVTALSVATVSAMARDCFAEHLICGYVMCDTSYEVCDEQIDDCVNCTTYCKSFPEDCKLKCPMFYEDMFATTPSVASSSAMPSTFIVVTNVTSVATSSGTIRPSVQNLNLIIPWAVVIGVLLLTMIIALLLLFVFKKIKRHRRRGHNRNRAATTDNNRSTNGDVESGSGTTDEVSDL